MVKSAFLSREPVMQSAEFIGREVEIAWLADKLGRQTPQNCNLVGEPRIGKTSLLRYVYQQKIGLPPGETAVYVWVRLAELTAYDSLSFWRLMAQKLVEEQVKAGFLAEVTAVESDDALDWFEALDAGLENLFSEVGLGRLVLLIDDFDLLVEREGIGKRDLDWLRALATRYGESLAFVIGSADSLVALTERMTGAVDVSPFANMFHHLSLGLLTPVAAERLCRQAAAVEELPLSDADSAFLLAEAGRHPDLLKIACGYLFAARRQDEAADYDGVAGDVRLDDRVRWLARRLMGRLSLQEQILLRGIGRGATAVADPILLNRLQKHLGLVEMRDGRPALFADAFRYWGLRQDEKPIVAETAVAALPAAPFKHHPQKRLVVLADTEIRLTSLENRLLTYFIQHKGQVCTIDDLLQNVWGPGKSRAVVEKGVNRLRTKIEEDPKRPRFLLSARGEGYRLVD